MSKLGELFDDVGKAYFNAEARPVTRVYIDLEYIQDLRFGALLYGVTVDAEMKYIHSRIKQYNNRYTLGTAEYFPVLKKTDKELDTLLHTPVVLDKICFLSPWTSVYFNFIELLVAIKQHNKRLLDSPPPITVVLNVSDVKYPTELVQYLSQTFSRQWDVRVEVQQLTRYVGDVSEYLEYQLMFLYDYGLFVNTFSSAFVGEGKFSNTRIIAQPYIDMSLGHKPEDYEYVLTSTEKGMDIYCDFSFLRSNITLDSDKE